MTVVAANAEQMLDLVLAAAREGESELHTVLATLPAPIYTTDAEGVVTFFNSACIGFAGRTPTVGKDRWCVTWKLYTAGGAPLPHDECPMAVAVRERRQVRDVVALAERPDGTRVMFAPYPTPLHDADGGFAGAVNILIDVTDARQAGELRAEAMRCRRLAHMVTDRRAVDTLLLMATEYDDKARSLRPS
ncbi:MAG TPA: PAS domain-containing protein [Allosphingosinicella sp.]|jgi:PAS domain S-box-containing protein|nr:PAS domain-containing protein [Allosphingosinicella sp.]